MLNREVKSRQGLKYKDRKIKGREEDGLAFNPSEQKCIGCSRDGQCEHSPMKGHYIGSNQESAKGNLYPLNV